MKVALVQVPMPAAADPLAVAPLGLGYIAASVKAKRPDVDISILNLAADTYESALEKLRGFDVYGWSCSSIDYHRAEALAKEVRSTESGSLHVIGGPHVDAYVLTEEPGLIDESCWDVLFVGEGEETFVQYLRDLLVGKPQRIYRSDRLEDIDKLPFPIRDPAQLGGSLLLGSNGTTAAICGSRGCSYNCAFCCTSCVWPGAPQYRSMANIVEEMRYLRDEFGVQEFWFTDDRLPIRLREHGTFAVQLGSLNVRWRASIRAREATNSYLLNLLREAGCVELAVGVESFDDFVLHVLNKKMTAAANEQAVNQIHAAGIAVRLLMVIGTPGETAETVVRNIDTLNRLEGQFQKLVLSALMPMPGSPIRAKPASYGVEILDPDPAHYDIRMWSAEDAEKLNDPFIPLKINTMTWEQQRDNLREMRMFMEELRRRTGV